MQGYDHRDAECGAIHLARYLALRILAYQMYGPSILVGVLIPGTKHRIDRFGKNMFARIALTAPKLTRTVKL